MITRTSAEVWEAARDAHAMVAPIYSGVGTGRSGAPGFEEAVSKAITGTDKPAAQPARQKRDVETVEAAGGFEDADLREEALFTAHFYGARRTVGYVMPSCSRYVS